MQWKVKAGLVCASFFFSGTALGAGMTLQFLEKKYKALAEEEIESAKKFLSMKYKTGDFASPVDLVEEKAVDITESLVERLQYAPKSQNDLVVNGRPVQEIVTNVYASLQFDFERESKKRENNRPYIITVDQFLANPEGHEQVTVEWTGFHLMVPDVRHGGMSVDVDEVDENHLHQFGYGSGDENIVYIRNDELERDYEILKETRDPEESLEHSFEPFMRRATEKEKKAYRRRQRERGEPDDDD